MKKYINFSVKKKNSLLLDTKISIEKNIILIIKKIRSIQYKKQKII